MSSFTEKLEYDKLPKIHWWHKQRYIIRKEFIYYVGELGSDDFILTPPLFITDFASTPRVLHWIYPPRGWYAKAVLTHDRVYQFPDGRTRNQCDLIMYEGMIVLARSIVGGPNIPPHMLKTAERFYYWVDRCGEKQWSIYRDREGSME